MIYKPNKFGIRKHTEGSHSWKKHISHHSDSQRWSLETMKRIFFLEHPWREMDNDSRECIKWDALFKADLIKSSKTAYATWETCLKAIADNLEYMDMALWVVLFSCAYLKVTKVTPIMVPTKYIHLILQHSRSMLQLHKFLLVL